MITLGITGRSGCGKSTVTAVFAAHGVPLVDADQISREILLPGSPLLPVLARRFGADILYADGSLNRHLLADRAFAAPRLNAQTPEEVLLARADLVLRNDADLASLEAAAAALCEQLQAEGARKGGADTSL